MRFPTAYVNCGFNAVQAGVAIGMSKRSAHSNAHRDVVAIRRSSVLVFHENGNGFFQFFFATQVQGVLARDLSGSGMPMPSLTFWR